jgi:hypothetical protein
VSSLGALAIFLLSAGAAADPGAGHSLVESEWQPGSSAIAQAPEPERSEQEPAPAERTLAIGASLVPGVVVHGAGHAASGKPKTGTRLLLLEGIGLGLALVSGVTLALTGASRYLVGPTAIVGITGVGMFGVSWLADVTGTALPEDARSRALPAAPLLESRLGAAYVYDPQFRYRSFVIQSLDLRWRALRLAPSAWFAQDDDNARYRLAAGYRFFGPRPDRAARDGSFLDLELALTEHRYTSDGFRTRTGEAFLGGRVDLDRMDPHLGGMFAELGFGWGLSVVDYDFAGVSLESDTTDLLLGRFAFGGYLGSGGELSLFYDHRHDDLAAGMKLTGLGSGVAGHFGLDARFYFGESWGVRAEAMVGSAYVTSLSLLFRQGGIR